MNSIRYFLIFLLLPFVASCRQRTSDVALWGKVEQAAKKGSGRKTYSGQRKKRVVIDAGHGGNDYGTHSIEKPRYHEKFMTLATALMVRDHLSKMGYQVIMTRSTDTFISLDQRAAIANTRKADLFVSLHFNSAPSRKANGAEIFFYDSRKEKGRAAKSKRLAQKVLAHVTKTSKVASRGVKAGNFSVIRNTDMPAILVEAGFLTNASEMRRLKDPKMLNRIAWAIAQGVDEFFK